MPQTHSSLRKSLQLQRNSLSQNEREHFDYCIQQTILKSGVLLRSLHIAGYLSCNGEPSLDCLIQTCGQRKRPFYLPVIKQQALNFALYKWGDDLQNALFNIPEPSKQRCLSSKFLSIILLPLVGFDRHGNRLGMGGGYYDRTLSFSRRSACKKKPLLIGIAYSLQKVSTLPQHERDIPLDAVITEKGLLCFSLRAKQLLRVHL